MAFKDWLALTKTVLNLTDDIKKSREEVKTLSSQLNTLTIHFTELKTKFESFANNEFKNFTDQESLKREKFSESERHEREKFMQEIKNIFAQAEIAQLKLQAQAPRKAAAKKGTKKQLGDGKAKS